MDPALTHVDRLLRSRKLVEAEQAISAFIAKEDKVADGYILLAKLRQLQGRFEHMMVAATRAKALSPESLVAQFQCIEACVQSGQISEALNALESLQKKYATNPKVLQIIAEIYSHVGRFELAWGSLQSALNLTPNNPQLMYNAAAAAMAVGEIEQAETLFDKVIACLPNDYDAYYNRSTLKKQHADNNHIEQLEGLVKQGFSPRGGEVQVRYALAKEYEDLGEWAKSFEHLKAGADLRASMLSYKVDDDLQTMQSIKKVMNEDWCAGINAETHPGPIFILGMPRTGTTLVDRILSAHSNVISLGEINDFALAMMSGIGQVSSKAEAVEKSASVDFTQLANRYLKSTAERSMSATPYLIDKTPANFLYIGLIAKALPNAKIINLERHPMDSCYAIYKTLFRMGYPFSYDLKTLGKYYLGYRSLMDHWAQVLPNRVFSVNYESLVTNTEPSSRELLSHCGLEWEQNCLSFHKSDAAVATASAVQVRRPMYTSSLEKWKHFENELRPLRDVLIDGGLVL
jgi:tetratricopeptide (TPR) repeat protein